MIPNLKYNIWEHSANVLKLYAERAHGRGEMDASAQCAEILAPFINSSAAPPRLLDVGCGSGYLWHSFRTRGLNVEYFGLDYSPSLIDIGRRILPQYGLPAERLICQSIENLDDLKCDLAALLNTLTFCADFRQPLDRLAATGARVLAIRDNFGPQTIIKWETDGYLDDGHNHLKGYWNRWSVQQVKDFLAEYGYDTTEIEDKRTRGGVEMVVDKPYYWSWLLAVRKID